MTSSEADNTHGDVLRANHPGASQIEIGMDVLGVDGHSVGRVKEVRDGDFLLDRPMAHDLYVPYQFVLSVPDRGEKPARPTEVVLTLTEDQLDKQDWPHA